MSVTGHPSPVTRLRVLWVPGFTLEMVQRGDAMAEIFELIAEGGLAEVADAPGLETFRNAGGIDWLLHRPLAGGDARALGELDRRIGELRSQGPLALLSEHVFISPVPLPGLRPGSRLRTDEVVACLRSAAAVTGDGGRGTGDGGP